MFYGIICDAMTMVRQEEMFPTGSRALLLLLSATSACEAFVPVGHVGLSLRSARSPCSTSISMSASSSTSLHRRQVLVALTAITPLALLKDASAADKSEGGKPAGSASLCLRRRRMISAQENPKAKERRRCRSATASRSPRERRSAR